MNPVLQLHYTACRHGQGKGSGFQIRAQSPGLAPHDAAELVRLGLHTTPENAPCPVALRVLTLTSGGRAIQRSVYTGQDYSGREGNFFTHSLVFSADAGLPDPFALWHWPGWAGNLEEAGGDHAPPAPLPVLDDSAFTGLASCEATEMSAVLDMTSLAAFVRETPERTALFEQLLAWLMLPEVHRRPIILRDEAHCLLPWQACLWRALPPERTAQMTVSTYQGEPSSRFDIMGTVEGTRFEPLPPHVFAMFDQQNSVYPDLLPLVAGEAHAEAARLVRRFFTKAIPLDALRVALAHGNTAAGAQRLLRLHGLRHDLVDCTSMMQRNEQETGQATLPEAVWGLPPLVDLGLAFTGTDVRRLCALLALLPAHEAAAWLKSACEHAAPSFKNTVQQALELLIRVHPAQANALQIASQHA